jgi:hypothetical protein
MRYVDLRYLSGRITAERAQSGKYHVTFERNGVVPAEVRPYDLVIVRHGPESAIRRLVGASSVEQLEAQWRTNVDITTMPHWIEDGQTTDHEFFFEFGAETALAGENALDLARTTFDSVYQELSRDPDIQWVGVGRHEGNAGFIATLVPGATPRQSVFYAGVQVQFVGSAAAQTSSRRRSMPARPSRAGSRVRLVQAGAAIYNYDAQQRIASQLNRGPEQGVPPGPAAPSPEGPSSFLIGRGTLGCFAMDPDGQMFLISVSHVLSPNGHGEQGDRIYLEGESPLKDDKPIAKLDSYRPSQRQTDFTDIASARLERDVRPGYRGDVGPWLPSRVGIPLMSDRIAKVGTTSGLTVGRVVDTAKLARVAMGNAMVIQLEDCILIESEEVGGFMLPGDSGAITVREDGTAVGLLIAEAATRGENKPIAVACSLERSLQDLNLTLLTMDALRSRSRTPRQAVDRHA